MMKDVIKLNMELKINEEEIKTSFRVAIQRGIDENLTNKEKEEIEKLSIEMAKIVSKAVERKLDEEMEKEEELERDFRIDETMEKTKEELYEFLSEEDKRKVDEFEKKLKKCNTIKDAIKLAIDEIEKELK